jgi:hypothetical protein
MVQSECPKKIPALPKMEPEVLQDLSVVQSKCTKEPPALPEIEPEVLQAPAVAAGIHAKEEHLWAVYQQMVRKRENKRKLEGGAADDLRCATVKHEHEADTCHRGAVQQLPLEEVQQRLQLLQLVFLNEMLQQNQQLLQKLKKDNRRSSSRRK